jgi:hypothetical protein
MTVTKVTSLTYTHSAHTRARVSGVYLSSVTFVTEGSARPVVVSRG